MTSDRPKIDWEDFEEYHDETMAFIETTQERIEDLLDILLGRNLDASARQSESLSRHSNKSRLITKMIVR